ncbi:hypothetical protein D3C72_2513000 [compost metagenome]
MHERLHPGRGQAHAHPAHDAQQDELRQVAADSSQQAQQDQTQDGLHPWIEFGNQ